MRQSYKILVKSIFGILMMGMIVLSILFQFPNSGSFNEFLIISEAISSKTTDKYVLVAEQFFDNGISVFTEIRPTIAGSAVYVNQGVNRDSYYNEDTEVQAALDSGVTSIINLRYDNKIYLIEQDSIERILGNATDIASARENYLNSGDQLVREVVESLLLTDETNVKYTQKNIDGILQDEISGFKVYQYRYGPNLEDAISEVSRVLSTRLAVNEGNQDYISVQKIEHIGTNGEYSNDKYLELDDSGQMIYAWENGELYKSWQASGFYTEVAVFGVFDLKNKAKNAWSPGAEKWMPYWMAFYYDQNQAAWFGLHELVYWYDDEGVYHQESNESIGRKKSAGCVRLDRGEMVELYDWAEVGIHFLIYE